MAYKSPFEDASNPFQDPSITSALNSNREEMSYSLDADPTHHDDFSGTSYQHLSDTHDPYGSSFTPKAPEPVGEDLVAKEESLRQKERELAERERILEQQQLRRQGGGMNNFPPCFPLMYLDIPAEIPPEHQWTVWWIYREWLLFELTLVLNFIACLCVLFSHPASVTSGPTDLGISLTEMFTHTLASFFLWYRPAYNAYMKDVSLYYFSFFIFNGFHILYTFYKAVGIPSTGGAGLILLVSLFSDGFIVTGIFTLLAAICWLVMGFGAIYLYKRTYDHYKSTGHTFSEAKQEAFVRMGRSAYT
ncbi:scamp family-domain-containing protein [Phycomyces nitens]|nr:scamp family-domain-containing protein [Phycomyces nitens]